MISIRTRPLTDEERKLFEQSARQSDSRRLYDFRRRDAWVAMASGFATFGLLGAVGGLVIGLILSFAAIPFVSDGRLYLVAGALIGAWSWFAWAWSGDSARQEKRIQDRKRHREARVIEIRSDRIARCPPFEYRGRLPPAFFAEVAPGQLIFLQGDYLRNALRAGRFPSAEMWLIQSPDGHETRLVQCLGPKLDLTPIDESAIVDKECYVPADAEVIPGALATLAGDLRVAKQARRKRDELGD